MTGKIILEEAVRRRPGYLYYIDSNGNVCESEMHHGRKKKENVVQKKVKKK